MSSFPWGVLGIAETTDRGAIRKAYSARLKDLDLDQQIQEYAELREARDYALHLAANPPAEEDDFGLGSLDDDQVTVPEVYEGSDGFEWEITDGDLVEPEEGGDVGASLSGSELDPVGAGPVPEAELPDGWSELASLIFPQGDYSNEAFTFEEAEQAEAALERLIAWAEAGDLQRHANVDHNLAEMLAGGWPRSAPVVDQANTAFHWLGEAGGLDERPALQFLNARTEGMRFHDAVLMQDHPFHKAWVQLSQPGKVGRFERLGYKTQDIHDLLAIIRQRFPELESLLDSERVQSWEAPSSDIVSYIVQRIFIVFLIVQALRFCVNVADGPDTPVPTPQPQVMAPTEQEVDAVVEDIFGAGFTMNDVRLADPQFVNTLRNWINLSGYIEDFSVAQRMRFTMRRALKTTDRDTAIALQAIYRDWLRGAPDEAACRAIQEGEFPKDNWTDVTRVLEYEREQARKMLREGQLSKTPESSAPTSERFNIPGWVIERAMNQSGLPEEVFRQRFNDASSPRACEASIAILNVIVSQPGRVEDDLLRGMW